MFPLGFPTVMCVGMVLAPAALAAEGSAFVRPVERSVQDVQLFSFPGAVLAEGDVFNVEGGYQLSVIAAIELNVDALLALAAEAPVELSVNIDEVLARNPLIWQGTGHLQQGSEGPARVSIIAVTVEVGAAEWETFVLPILPAAQTTGLSDLGSAPPGAPQLVSGDLDGWDGAQVESLDDEITSPPEAVRMDSKETSLGECVVRNIPLLCDEEPDCNEAPSGPGIMNCKDAAGCRREKCHWAGCVNTVWAACEEGSPTASYDPLPCDGVYVLELMTCLPAFFWK